MNSLSRLFKKQSALQGVTLEIKSGFTVFSGTTYNSAAFRSAVDAIVRHAAKLQEHADEPTLERLLCESPNAYMTAYDLLYKTATAYFTANNAFILIDRADNCIRALYPLSPASVEFVAHPGAIYTPG